MTAKRKKRIEINRPAQLAALTSPLSVDILQAVRTGGPTSVANLAPRIGRKAVSLHYHVRKLKRLGYLRVVDTKRSGARTESIYDVTANFFDYDMAPADPKLAKLVSAIFASLLRLATRNFAAAIKRPNAAKDRGPHRNLVISRHKARLTKTQLAKINKHLDAIRETFVSATRTRGGQLVTFTHVLTPEPDRNNP